MNLPDLIATGLDVTSVGLLFGVFYRMGGLTARVDSLEKRHVFKPVGA